MLPATLIGLFNGQVYRTSTVLQTFYLLLPDIALVGTHTRCTNLVAYFLGYGAFKSVWDRIK